MTRKVQSRPVCAHCMPVSHSVCLPETGFSCLSWFLGCVFFCLGMSDVWGCCKVRWPMLQGGCLAGAKAQLLEGGCRARRRVGSTRDSWDVVCKALSSHPEAEIPSWCLSAMTCTHPGWWSNSAHLLPDAP